MKKLISLPFMALSVSTLFAFTMYKSIMPVHSIIEIESRPVELLEIEPIAYEIEIIKNTRQDFLNAIGARESSGRYDIVNQFGYMGKYQFGRSTLNGLGYTNISNEIFLASPALQEEAMRKLMLHNKKILNRYIKKYNGKELHGILVTESGLIAAAHLGGPGSVKKWIRKGSNFKDGLGTSIESYMVKFSGYRLEL